MLNLYQQNVQMQSKVKNYKKQITYILVDKPKTNNDIHITKPKEVQR